MQAPDRDESSPDDFEHALRRSLFRFDCPAPDSLGEYYLDLLDPVERTQVAAHAADCELCQAELQTLRAYMATPLSTEPSVLARARRMVATLFSPRPGLAYGGLRGAADASTRVYQAGDVTVTLGPGAAPRSLMGLILTADPATGAPVALSDAQGRAVRTEVDDLGNFEFIGVASGDYTLEIQLPDGVVVIEALHVD